ncbi:MAG TPA: peptidylprolyl isomerase [Longimicrobiales bacterium]|nr:peptidylprolyl isomerase [Longimicrobiales bacterium]
MPGTAGPGTGSPARAGARSRERPAMVACPWPRPPAAATVADTASPPPPAGVIDPPRARIPDCAPPGWKPPARLKTFVRPTRSRDRPKPLVDDYLKYVVTAPPPEVVARYELDTTYYRKYADANGFPILASAKVSDAALAIVRDQVNYMLGSRPDIRDTMIAHGARIGIMAETEYTMDVPEQRRWRVPRYLDPRLTYGERARYYEPGGLGSMTPEAYWNPRARGMGGTFTTCAEENVLGYYGTRYWGTNICVHEFSHGIMGAGIGNADPAWFQEIVDAYKAAKATCLKTALGYAGNTFNEYWAVGVEWYVGSGGKERAALRAEDPRLYGLIARLIPEDKGLPLRANVAAQPRERMETTVRERNPAWWRREQRRQAEAADSARRAGRPRRPQAREPACVPQRPSPAADTPATILLHPEDPRWAEHAPDAYEAVFETSRGRFVVEVRREWAPNGADRFYDLVRNGYYDGGRFHRVIKGFIAQWGLHGDPAVYRVWKTRYIPDDPVKLGNARGTIGFAMTGPDTRSTQVYINTGDNTRIDAQGFAAFGRVREGMEVVDSLYSGYGDGSGGGVRAGRQGPLEAGGNAYLQREYPKLDYIEKAWIRPR